MENFENKSVKHFLWIWLLSNTEVALQHCSATKTTKMSSSLFCSTTFNLGGHNS